MYLHRELLILTQLLQAIGTTTIIMLILMDMTFHMDTIQPMDHPSLLMMIIMKTRTSHTTLILTLPITIIPLVKVTIITSDVQWR